MIKRKVGGLVEKDTCIPVPLRRNEYKILLRRVKHNRRDVRRYAKSDGISSAYDENGDTEFGVALWV